MPGVAATMRLVGWRLCEWTKALTGERGRRGLWLPRSVGDYLRRMRGAQCYADDIGPPPSVLVWSFFSGLTSFIAIAVLTLVHKYGAAIRDHDLPFAIAPAGASAVLIFAVPASPLAQPRNVIVGHMIAALMGTFMHALFGNVADSFRWMPAALAVGTAIGIMGLTNCYHPPAGATALLGGYFSADIERVGWWFPLYPVLPVSLILVAVGVILNNICRVYPIYWFTAADAPKVSVELPVHKSQQATHDSDPVPQEPASTTSSNTRDDSAIPSPEIHADREAGDGTEIAWLRTRVQGLEQEVAELRGATARAD